MKKIFEIEITCNVEWDAETIRVACEEVFGLGHAFVREIPQTPFVEEEQA